jgi:hypothetical protein
MHRLSRIGCALSCAIFALLGILPGCGSGSGSGSGSGTTTPSPSTPSQFTHVYVVFPPATGENNLHFMSTVMTQPAIEGVTVPNNWKDAETGTPGPGTCTPTSTNGDTCQQDAFGWTHTYDWTTIDNGNGQWFAAQSGTKKVNILLYGISEASSLCLITNTCINSITPYYVTTSSWAAHTAAGNQDFINGNKDNCSNYVGLISTSMTRDQTGLVTVTEPNHGYVNGDTIWIGGSTPANYNIAHERVGSVQVASNVLTIAANNSFPAGIQVTFQNLGQATFLNGQTVTIASSSPTEFAASFANPNYGPTAETGGTADPLGVQVQGVTVNTFQYQTGILTADSASVPGTVISAQQSYPVPYETPYKTALESFIAAAIVHFNASPNLSQIAYMRVGRSVGGEAFPFCPENLELLPAPNTFTKAGWLQYYTDIDNLVQSLNPKMQILDPLNQAGSPTDPTYGSAEAAIAVAHTNASGAANGFGSQGLQASDIASYAVNPLDCTSDWCGTFNTYYHSGMPLELQQSTLSAPVPIAGTESATSDLRPLLPFAVERHMTILELYQFDALLAYDPNYCVLTVPDTGVCTTGSVSIPAITLPPADQYPYFQAVGQPGQKGATGDGSYAATVNSTEGAH